MKCEICGKPARWTVFRGIDEELCDTGHPVCRRHALADKALTAIEPLLSTGLFCPSALRAKTLAI